MEFSAHLQWAPSFSPYVLGSGRCHLHADASRATILLVLLIARSITNGSFAHTLMLPVWVPLCERERLWLRHVSSSCDTPAFSGVTSWGIQTMCILKRKASNWLQYQEGEDTCVSRQTLSWSGVSLPRWRKMRGRNLCFGTLSFL